MEIGVKESSKKLVSRTRADRVEKWQMKNWQREQIPRKWRGNGGEEDQHCNGDCIKIDLERVGEEWGNDRYKELETADRERSQRKVRGRKKTMEKEIMVNSPLTTVMPRK